MVDLHIACNMSEKKSYIHGCPVCGKLFSRRDVYRCHMRIHKNEKPYGCSYCGKTFAHRGNRNQHVATHQQRKQFQCEFCDKLFSLKIFLNRHIKNVHPENYVPSHIGYVECNRRGTKSLVKLNHISQATMGEQQSPSQKSSVPQTQTILKGLLSNTGSMKSLLQGNISSHNFPFSGPSTYSETMGNSVSNSNHNVQEAARFHPATEPTNEEMVYVPQALHKPAVISDDQLKCHLCPLIFDKRHKYQLHIMMHELKQSEPMLDGETDRHQTSQMFPHSETDNGKKLVYVCPKFKGFSKEDMKTVEMIYTKTAAIKKKLESKKYPEVDFIKQEVTD